jgi:hypothetical protein
MSAGLTRLIRSLALIMLIKNLGRHTFAAAPQSAVVAHDSASPLLDPRSPVSDRRVGRPRELATGRIRPGIGCVAASGPTAS